MTIIRSQSTTRRRKRSMQYYRLWIYSCNGVLGITSAIFAISAAFVLADVRLSLLGGVELYHPTFLYAYVALILQCGVVQTIGCFAARRLSQRLLSVYWILLLVLTIGDVVVGLAWVIKLDQVKLSLRPLLTGEFISKYSTDESFTRTWNIVQSEDHCCGVDGPLDYEKLSQVQSQHSTNKTSSSLRIDVESSLLYLPESCCIVIDDPTTLSGGGSFRDSLNKTYHGPSNSVEKEFTLQPNESEPEFGGGGNKGRNDRVGDNVINQFSTGGDATFPKREKHSGVSNSLNVHSDFNYDSLALKDAPHQPDSSESIEGLTDDKLLDSLEEKQYPHDIRVPLTPSFAKHKVRHGNHRWKLPFPSSSAERNDSNNSVSNLVKSDRLPQVAALSNEESLVDRRNISRPKPKQKLLPSFSFSPKIHPNLHSSAATTEEPEYAEKLPVPFTCRRHLKLRTSRRQDQSDIYQANHNNQHSSSATFTSSERDKSKVEIGEGTTETLISVPDRLDGSSGTEKTNEIGNSRDELNNDGHEHSFLRNQEFLQGSQHQNRRKRNPASALSGSNIPVSNSRPVVGSHVFNFLHASAFTSSENSGNSVGGESGESHTTSTATEIQAAYYFASPLYQSNPHNASLAKRFQVYRKGCGVKLLVWVDHVSGILFILGFCIIGFVKACFLVILRTEIREMIEKIQLLELDDPVSPSRAHSKDQRLYQVSHPLLSHPHRASTVSAHAYNVALPTIKSPEGHGPTGPLRFPKSYQQRRHSNIIGDRSSAHSQETVNMTLLVTNNGNNGPGSSQSESKQEKGRSNPNLNFCGGNFLLGRDDFDPISISVPNAAKYLRRSSTCSATAHTGPSYGYIHNYDDVRPGPSSRFYHHEIPHHHMYHQHCVHGHHARPRLYQRNMSIGAVVHHSSSAGGGGPSGSATTSAFRPFGGESGSGNCSLSSRDENEILSSSMENMTAGDQQSVHPQSDEEKEKLRREAEIRDWAASTTLNNPGELNEVDECGGEDGDEGVLAATPTTAAQTLGNKHTKTTGFNHSSDSAESNDRNSGGRKNGNNNVNVESIPLSCVYLGTAV